MTDPKEEKTNYHFFPAEIEEMVAEVMTFGGTKHGDFDWRERDPEEIKKGCYNALRRHTIARRKGEKYDKETRLPHLVHAICCLIMWLDTELREAKCPNEKPSITAPGAVPLPVDTPLE